MLTQIQRLLIRTSHIREQLQMLRIETKGDAKLKVQHNIYDKLEGELNDALGELIKLRNEEHLDRINGKI